MALKLLFGPLIMALVSAEAVYAQSVSPAGQYSKKSAGVGAMRVEKSGQDWRVFVSAGGKPRGGATAADCTLISSGRMKGNTFHGEIKNQLDSADEAPSAGNAVESGHKITITFAPQLATVTAADVDSLCAQGTGIFGRYTKGQR